MVMAATRVMRVAGIEVGGLWGRRWRRGRGMERDSGRLGTSRCRMTRTAFPRSGDRSSPCAGVRRWLGERLRQQRCLGVHRRQVTGQESSVRLLQAADDVAGVALQSGQGIGSGLFGQRRGLRLLLVE
jgi:hypothetical protein